MSEEKPLENFIFYKNAKRGETVEGIIEQYNSEHTDKPISSNDVKFGPTFHDFGNAYPEICATGFHFKYFRGDGEKQLSKVTPQRDIEVFQGVFIYEEKSNRENLAKVIETIKKESYYESMSIKTAFSNEFEGFFVNGKLICSYIREICEDKDWQFEEFKAEEGQSSFHTKYGHLTTENFTYLVQQLPYAGLTLFDKEGDRIDLSKGEDDHRKVLMLILEPIQKELSRQEAEFYEYWGDIDDDGYA